MKYKNFITLCKNAVRQLTDRLVSRKHIQETLCGRNTDYFRYGVLHRTDGPAVIRNFDFKAWYLYGHRHREDGPAVEWYDGTRWWYTNHMRHREDGPAVEHVDGYNEFWLNDVQIDSELEFWIQVELLDSKK